MIPLAVNLTSSAIYDLIKETVAAARVRKRTRIEQYRQPDGTEVTVITVDE